MFKRAYPVGNRLSLISISIYLIAFVSCANLTGAMNPSFSRGRQDALTADIVAMAKLIASSIDAKRLPVVQVRSFDYPRG